MKLFYKDDNDKLRFVSNPNSIKEALNDINIYTRELNPNFKIPYKRLNFGEKEICVDVGSWSEFFYITEFTEEDLKKIQEGEIDKWL